MKTVGADFIGVGNGAGMRWGWVSFKEITGRGWTELPVSERVGIS